MAVETLPGVKVTPAPLTKEERYQRWLGFWKIAAALPCPERIMASVRRPHQQRGVPQKTTRPAGPRDKRPDAVVKKLIKHHRLHGYPTWPGYTPAREVA